MIFELIGFLLVYMPTHLEKHKGKVAEFEGSLDEGETLLKSGKVSVKEGGSKQEHGSMMLTNRRLLYSGTVKTDKEGMTDEDVGSNDFELLFGDIASVETKFPNYIIIKDKNNKLDNNFKAKLKTIEFEGNLKNIYLSSYQKRRSEFWFKKLSNPPGLSLCKIWDG